MIAGWAVKEVIEEELVTLDTFGINLNVDVIVVSTEKDKYPYKQDDVS